MIRRVVQRAVNRISWVRQRRLRLVQVIWWLIFDRMDFEEIFPPVRALGVDQLRNAVVAPDRRALVADRVARGGIGAEVGIGNGHHARALLDDVAPRELHLIDDNFSEFERSVIESELADGRAQMHTGDSATVLAGFPDAYFDWLYIDADHSYQGVKRDIEQAVRTLKPDGVIVFNDYILFSHFEMLPYGVVHAVNELCLDEGWEMVGLALQSQMYCDVAVRRQTRPQAQAAGG
jgi:hypothetical protein